MIRIRWKEFNSGFQEVKVQLKLEGAGKESGPDLCARVCKERL